MLEFNHIRPAASRKRETVFNNDLHHLKISFMESLCKVIEEKSEEAVDHGKMSVSILSYDIAKVVRSMQVQLKSEDIEDSCRKLATAYEEKDYKIIPWNNDILQTGFIVDWSEAKEENEE